MENASKALIIAGAILLAILIIGLGMFIYQKAAGAMDTSTIDQQKVQAYNTPYEQYFGTNVSGSNLKALIDAVNTHNVSVGDDSLKIKVNSTGSSTDSSIGLTGLKTGIKAGKTYNVVAGKDAKGTNAYDTKTGYIINIFYAENK